MIRMPFNEPFCGPVGRAMAESAVWSAVHDSLGEPPTAMLVNNAGEVIAAEDGAAIVTEG